MILNDYRTIDFQDLLEQREKLEKADKNLDEIHSVAQMTQRSLNSLKSVFGGYFKNKFSRTPKQTSQVVQSSSDLVYNGIYCIFQEMPGSKSETQLRFVFYTAILLPFNIFWNIFS